MQILIKYPTHAVEYTETPVVLTDESDLEFFMHPVREPLRFRDEVIVVERRKES